MAPTITIYRRRPRFVLGLATGLILVGGLALTAASSGSPPTRGPAQPAVEPAAADRDAPDHDQPSVETAEPPSLAAEASSDSGEPPQFVVVSFDGGGNVEQWQRWRSAAEAARARMTFFVSGVYLIPETKATLYDPPGKPAGSSEIGFSAVETLLPRIEQLRAAHHEDHEIGTHYNGHFCGRGGVSSWSTAQWRDELAQFDSFLTHWPRNADAPDAEALPFGPDDIVGGRTPCLQGLRSELYPALVERGFRYDTSGYGSLRWPTQRTDGLWDIPLQALRLAGSGAEVLSMDYNFYDLQSGAAPAPPEQLARLRQQMLDTYRNAYRAVRTGNRAPLILGAHFSRWNDGIYADALEDFVREVCSDPETQCVSFLDLVTWLDAQPADRIAQLQSRPVQGMEF